MGYSIILERRFLRFNTGKFKGIIPLVLVASSNVYESSFSNRRARSWDVVGPASLYGNKFWASEKNIVPASLKVTGPDIAKYRGDWLANTEKDNSYIRFLENGINAALTLDELKTKYVNHYLNHLAITCIIQYEINGKRESYSCVATNNQEVNEMMDKAKEILEIPDVVVIKKQIEYNTDEPFKLLASAHQAKPKRRPACEEPTFFTIRNDNGVYLARLHPLGYKYTYSDHVAKSFRTKASAQKWLNEHAWRLNDGKGWSVFENHNWSAIYGAFPDTYEKVVLTLEKNGVSPYGVNHALFEANYLLKQWEGDVSKAFVAPEHEALFRVWQFSKGVYTTEAFAEMAKSNKWYR